MTMKFLDYLNHHQIKVLIFDKDGTLTDTSALWLEPTLQVIEALLERNGMRLNKEENRILYEKLGITSSEIIENSVIATGSVRDMLEVIAQFGEFDIEENYQFTVQFFYQYITSNPDKIIALGNVKKTLQRFKELGFTLALVTNDSKLPTKAVLEVLKVESLFDFIGTTDDFPSKPAIDALEAISNVFHVSFHEMIYIGDSSIDEEFASHTAGFVAVVNNEDNDNRLKTAFCKVNSIEELIKEN